MIKRISKWVLHISRGWLALGTTLLMVLFLILVLPSQSGKSLEDTGSSRSPDTAFFYTPEELYQIAQEYGQVGRQAYIKTRWTFDLIFPLVYTSFLAVGISWFYQHLSGWKEIWRYGNLVPILGGIFDYLENGAASWVMAIFPARLPGLAQLTVIFSLGKWILISLAFLIYIIFGVGAFAGRVKKKPAS
jgi:hypothetical protein